MSLEKFSLICRRHDYRWRDSNFDLYSTLVFIEQWGLLRVTHGTSVYNGQRGTCYQALGSGAPTTSFNDLGLSRQGIETGMQGERSTTESPRRCLACLLRYDFDFLNLKILRKNFRKFLRLKPIFTLLIFTLTNLHSKYLKKERNILNMNNHMT